MNWWNLLEKGIYRLDTFPTSQPTASKHWRVCVYTVLGTDFEINIKMELNRTYNTTFVNKHCIMLTQKNTGEKQNKKLSYCRETARQLRIHEQLTRCFSAVAV